MSLKRLKKPKVVFNKRSKRWGVDYDILDEGRVRRVQRHFIYTNKSEAEEKAQEIEDSQEPKVTDKAKLVLNNAQIHETLWALEELEKMPFSQKSLRDAILFFRDNYHEPKQYPRLATLIENYLKLKKEHQSLGSYEQHRPRLRNFKKAFRGKNVHEVSSEDIIEYLRTKSEGQQLKYLTYLSTFYNYICDPANPKPIGIKNPITAVKFYYQKRNTHAAAKRKNKSPTILYYDVFRHTYVTWLYNWKESNKKYRYTLDDVIRQVGHSMQVNSDHYRGKIFNDEDANDYWNLTYQSICQKIDSVK